MGAPIGTWERGRTLEGKGLVSVYCSFWDDETSSFFSCFVYVYLPAPILSRNLLSHIPRQSPRRGGERVSQCILLFGGCREGKKGGGKEYLGMARLLLSLAASFTFSCLPRACHEKVRGIFRASMSRSITAPDSRFGGIKMSDQYCHLLQMIGVCGIMLSSLVQPASGAICVETSMASGAGCGSLTNDYQVCIRLDKKEFTPVEPILLHVTVSNRLDRGRLLPSGHPDSRYEISVFRAESGSVPRTAYGEAFLSQARRDRHLRTMGIRANDTITESFILNRFFDLSMPGTYEVSVRRRISEADSGPRAVFAESGVLTFTILEKIPEVGGAWGGR